MDIRPVVKPNNEVSPDSLREGDGEILDAPAQDTEKPLPLRALLTQPVVVSITNYCMIALLEIMGGSLMPLVWSTSVDLGGLGMSPAPIGLWMAGYGVMNGIIQFAGFPRIVGRFGPRRVFIASTFCFIPIFILLPLENLALRQSTRDLNLGTTLLIVLQLTLTCFAGMGFGAFPRILHCARSLKCGSTSCDVYVYILCCPKQAVSRRHKWDGPDDDLNSAHDRTSCCCVAVCILTREQYLGWEFRVCRHARHCVDWAAHRCSSSGEYVETRMVIVKLDMHRRCTILYHSKLVRESRTFNTRQCALTWAKRFSLCLITFPLSPSLRLEHVDTN